MAKTPKKILSYLTKNKILHELLEHKTVYTAYDVAQTLKSKMEEIVKPLLVRVDQRYVVVAIPAHTSLDLPKLKKVLAAKTANLAKESAVQKLLKVKAGSLTAFGSVHGLEVVLDKSLSKMSRAIFSAGSFTESFRVKMKDFIEHEHPLIAIVGKKKIFKKPKRAKVSPKKKKNRKKK